MAVSLPDARQLSDEVLEALACVPCGAVNWASRKAMSPVFWACPAKPSRAGGRLTTGRFWRPCPTAQRPPCG